MFYNFLKRPLDFEKIATLFEKIFYQTLDDFKRMWVNINLEHSYYLYDENKDQIIGFSLNTIYDFNVNEQLKKVLVIVNFGINPEYQHQGYGTKLFEETKKALENKFDYIFNPSKNSYFKKFNLFEANFLNVSKFTLNSDLKKSIPALNAEQIIDWNNLYSKFINTKASLQDINIKWKITFLDFKKLLNYKLRTGFEKLKSYKSAWCIFSGIEIMWYTYENIEDFLTLINSFDDWQIIINLADEDYNALISRGAALEIIQKKPFIKSNKEIKLEDYFNFFI